MQAYPLPLLISALTALVASIVGPLVTLSVSRRQFRANVLSTNRQKWIDTFRDRLSELLSHINAAQATKRVATHEWCGGLGPVIADHTFADKLEKTYRAIAQIQLLTKPEEPTHQALSEAIGAALAYLQADELHEAELSASLLETTRLGRGIIREEWGRVKRGV
jgi:hypothetical protein